jgi:prevent-host-death family protein
MPRETVVNLHAAKTNLSKLVALAERGEHVTIARAGRPVVRLVPVAKKRRLKLSPDDPLLNLDKYSIDGPGGKLTNREIDRLIYGA